MTAILKALSRVKIITSPASGGDRLVTRYPSAELWAKPGKRQRMSWEIQLCGVNEERYLSQHSLYDIWKHNNTYILRIEFR
jgi:hypothetical protein